MTTDKPVADDALPEPGITTALVIDEAGRHVPMRLVGAYYTADQLRAAIARERAKSDALKSVMIAAAEEIAAHWDAHCDAEGYGPQNLMRRLEEGIPSEYGYTAGAFDALRQQLAEAKRDADRLNSRTIMTIERDESGQYNRLIVNIDLRSAIDAAIAAGAQK